MIRRTQFPFGAAAILFAASCLIMTNELKGQNAPQRLAIKNVESIELHPIYYVSQCHSIMIGLPEIEVLEGPPELKLSIKKSRCCRDGRAVPRKSPAACYC